MLELIFVIVVVGVILWFVNQYVPMEPAFKTAVNILAVLLLIFYILQYFGLMSGIHGHAP